MLRDKSLVPLSHQHQHALALCVRIDRALRAPTAKPDAAQWNREVSELFRNEISYHFAAEEKVLFPEAEKYPELRVLVAELLEEHSTMRRLFGEAAAGTLDAPALLALAETLSAHIRKEERMLFERLQELVPPEHLEQLGRTLDQYFGSSGMPGATCGLP
jgi:iron-sulfur cluster repair protein YtfE (RIC family)